MTTPYPPLPPGGPGYGPPGGYGPPPGGPMLATRPSGPVWPIVLVTVPFALFGLIPTIILSNRATQQRESTGRYWIAFGVSMLASIVLYVLVVIVLVFFVLAGTVAVVGAAAKAIPSVNMTRGPGVPSTVDPTDGPCAYTPTADRDASAPSLPDDPASTPTGTRTWTLVTSAGTIVVRLDAAAAPCTVQSIVHLTEVRFFDGTTCPRSVDQGLFLLQCGDPTGTGSGGPGYTYADENLDRADYAAGNVAMANTGADTNGSQFFLLDRDADAALDKSYTVFGTITSGVDVLDKIVAAGNDAANGAGDGRPTPAVTVTTATVS